MEKTQMKNRVAQRMSTLSPSLTLAISAKAKAMKQAGEDVVSFGVGEPDFNTPAHIIEAAKAALDAGHTKYTPSSGLLPLRKAICEKFQKDNGLEYEPSQIIVSNGAKQSLCNAILSIINPGDEVIIPTPAWVSYVEMVKLAEGVNVLVPASVEQDFKITPAQLEAAITPKTKMVLLCSPSNPTGSVYTREELKALADVLAKYPEIIILSDEIYEHINYTGEFCSIAEFPEVADRVVTVNGVSKAYAMTGWRIGFLAAPIWIAKATQKVQGQYSSNPSSVAQKAAEAAYVGSQDCIEEMRKAFERRRNLIVELLGEIPGLRINNPQGAFYIFPEVSAYFGKKNGDAVIKDSHDLSMYLLEEAHVATVEGAAFCAPDYIRLSYATSDENIKEAVARIKVALAKLA